MKKLDIDEIKRLKKWQEENTPHDWTAEEKAYVRKLRDAGIKVKTVIDNKLFKDISDSAVKNMYYSARS